MLQHGNVWHLQVEKHHALSCKRTDKVHQVIAAALVPARAPPVEKDPEVRCRVRRRGCWLNTSQAQLRRVVYDLHGSSFR